MPDKTENDATLRFHAEPRAVAFFRIKFVALALMFLAICGLLIWFSIDKPNLQIIQQMCIGTISVGCFVVAVLYLRIALDPVPEIELTPMAYKRIFPDGLEDIYPWAELVHIGGNEYQIYLIFFGRKLVPLGFLRNLPLPKEDTTAAWSMLVTTVDLKNFEVGPEYFSKTVTYPRFFGALIPIAIFSFFSNALEVLIGKGTYTVLIFASVAALFPYAYIQQRQKIAERNRLYLERIRKA